MPRPAPRRKPMVGATLHKTTWQSFVTIATRKSGHGCKAYECRLCHLRARTYHACGGVLRRRWRYGSFLCGLINEQIRTASRRRYASEARRRDRSARAGESHWRWYLLARLLRCGGFIRAGGKIEPAPRTRSLRAHSLLLRRRNAGSKKGRPKLDEPTFAINKPMYEKTLCRIRKSPQAPDFQNADLR